jgi:cAMP phosphodiesterase
MRNHPITIYAIPETLDILKQHIFNWKVWPDFSQIPDAQHPAIRFQAVEQGKAVDMGGRKITPLPANHVVPAVGYRLDSGRASLVYSGDTTSNDALWGEVNSIENLRYLVIEAAFSNHEKELAVLSKHLCPELLAIELAKLKHPAEVFITHLKPDELELTMREVEQCLSDRQPRMLLNNQVFEF